MSNVSLVDGHVDGSETCVICGRDIPENSHYCVICGKTEPKDVVEVVRCKKCKNKLIGVDYRGDVYCTLHKIWVGKNAFCSYGVRRKKDDQT